MAILKYAVEHRRVKYLRLYVQNDATLKVVAPLRARGQDIIRFISERQDWIQKQLSRIHSAKSALNIQNNEIYIFGHAYTHIHKPEQKGVTLNTEKKHIYSSNDWGTLTLTDKTKILQKLAKTYIKPRIDALAKRCKLPFNKLSIRNQKGRWGSCSSKKDISINWRIMQLPQAVGDYVLIHELCHTQHMNHSKKFWNLVAHNCPNYQAAEQWLDDYGWYLLSQR